MRNDLGTPITLIKLKEAVMGMKMGKSPGWDGIPPVLYTTFWDLLGQFLLDMINFSIKNSYFLALLSALPKPGKDLTLCSNNPYLFLPLRLKLLPTYYHLVLSLILHNQIGAL